MRRIQERDNMIAKARERDNMIAILKGARTLRELAKLFLIDIANANSNVTSSASSTSRPRDSGASPKTISAGKEKLAWGTTKLEHQPLKSDPSVQNKRTNKR